MQNQLEKCRKCRKRSKKEARLIRVNLNERSLPSSFQVSLSLFLLPYDQPTTSPVLKFSVLNQSSNGRKYSLRADPSNLNSPVASRNVSCHGMDEPLSINLLRIKTIR